MRTQLYVKPLINYDVLVSVEFGRLDVYHSLYTYMYIYFRRRVPAGRAGLELGTQDFPCRMGGFATTAISRSRVIPAEETEGGLLYLLPVPYFLFTTGTIPQVQGRTSIGDGYYIRNDRHHRRV